MRSELRRWLDASCSGLWGSSLWVASAGRRAVPPWTSAGNLRVLVIAPHPDDEIGCGGAVLLHGGAGDRVTVLHVTDGRRSRALGLDPETMARRRRAEAQAGVESLGVHRWEWWGLPEGEWTGRDLAPPLERLLDELAPQVIYAPSRVDFHPEHREVAQVTADLLRGSSHRAGRVRVYPIQVPLTRALANLVAPLTPAIVPALLGARDCYSSQEGSLRAAVRLKRYTARAHHLPGMAEEFWEMSGTAYAALHHPAGGPAHSFRGLRRLALTDPLAFASGRAERRRLLALARDSGR
jgi:LmbE family N-acetylglucosaminyl deacetylase